MNVNFVKVNTLDERKRKQYKGTHKGSPVLMYAEIMSADKAAI